MKNPWVTWTLIVALAALGWACGGDRGSSSGDSSPPAGSTDGGGSTGGGGSSGGGSSGGGSTSPGTGGSGGTAGTFDRTTTVNGVTRTWRLYVPTSAMTAMASGPVPVIMAFHGAGDNGANFISATGLTSAASANSAILVGADAYPGNGGMRAWFLSSGEGWPGPGTNSLGNDVSFVLAIRAEVGGSYNIHTKKIYACGFSRGAGFTGILADTSNNPGAFSGSYSSPFAAYGICAGYDAFGGTLDLSAASPKRPIWMIHGTSDAAVPYSEGSNFASALTSAGWPVTFTGVSGAPHNWLWSPVYGYSNQQLLDFFFANPLP